MDAARVWPSSLIVDTHEEVCQFAEGLRHYGLTLTDRQLAELITQVFCIFLDGDMPQRLISRALPNFDMLEHADAYTEEQKELIRHYFSVLTRQFLDKTVSLGAWSSDANFPYAFDHFLGHDAVLFHLPF